MSLTRKMLKAMGIEDEKIDQIIEAHTETVDGLKASMEQAQADAKALPGVQKELAEAKADLEAAKNDGWKDKHDKVKKEFDDYKAGVTAKETKAAKTAAARSYYESKGITGKALDIAMLASGAQIDALELDGEKIKDAAGLESMVTGALAGLVGQTHTEGAPTATPPANTGGGMSKKDVLKMSYAERAALYQNDPAKFDEIMKGD